MKQVRCAIYTRKSSEEGLEQDFNSLDAQRQACQAYVLSQASEGWTALPDVYDDGGLSGGTLERPALGRLLSDIAAGRLDIIVVYKVDRLTRSLLDFAKLVEAFDKAGVSFVSITQSFNTTTSMGRLTLNMLLSFAQFEREVTTERIRDKIAASKARGMWMGGTPPLGYRPNGRSLAIVEEHAEIVRDIYRRYLALRNVRLLAEQLQGEGIRSPLRQRGSGLQFGGRWFTRGQLYAILKNQVYIGRIVHKDQSFPGKHPPIVEQDLWDAVQARLADNVQGRRTGRISSQSLLAGKVIGGGEELIMTHATKGKVRYRYYVSRSAHFDGAAGGMRIPAREIEGVVIERVGALFEDPLALLAQLEIEASPANINPLVRRCAELCATLKGSRSGEVGALVRQVRVGEGHVEIDVATEAIAQFLMVSASEEGPAELTLTEPMRLTRTGRVVRLVDRNGQIAVPRSPDPSLITTLTKARRWWDQLAEGSIRVETLARQEGVSPSWMIRVVRLAFLAPPVVEALLDGTLRADIDSAKLLRTGMVPACWSVQRSKFLAAK